MLKNCTITKETILPNIRPLPWDIVIEDTPYTIAHLEGFVHSFDKFWGNNDVWAWPRLSMPSWQNLIPYHGKAGATWGVRYEPCRVKIIAEKEIQENHTISITRNGKIFYQFIGNDLRGDLDLACDYISLARNHPIPFDTIHWRRELIRRDIWWRGEPGEIIDYVNRHASVIIQPCGISEFTLPEGETDTTKARIVKVTIFDDNINWFRKPGEK